MVNVLVEKEHFLFSRDLLESAGDFCARRLNRETENPEHDQITLEDVFVATTFKDFINWLLTGEILTFTLEQSTGKASATFWKTRSAMKLVLLGEKTQYIDLLNEAMSKV